MSLLSIGFLAMSEGIAFQIKRDREEEFIHRGVEYSRAVRRYVKKFSHYPPSLEALEKSNNVRFLRKRYKDPLTGKDFKVLYYGDVASFSPRNPAVPNTGIPTPGGTGVPKAGTSTPNRSVPSNGMLDGPPDVDPGSDPTTDSGAIQIDQDLSGQGQTATPGPQEKTDPAAQAAADAADKAASDAAEKLASTRVIVGVTSFSDRETIRIFNKKNHYNQWQFVYDPSTDKALMTGPNRPLPIGAGQGLPQQNDPKPQ